MVAEDLVVELWVGCDVFDVLQGGVGRDPVGSGDVRAGFFVCELQVEGDFCLLWGCIKSERSSKVVCVGGGRGGVVVRGCGWLFLWVGFCWWGAGWGGRCMLVECGGGSRCWRVVVF